jgi:hypothetical protein
MSGPWPSASARAGSCWTTDRLWNAPDFKMMGAVQRTAPAYDPRMRGSSAPRATSAVIRLQLLVVASLFICSVGSFAEESRRDGNWWNRQSAGFRVLYILGFMDGMDLGNRFSIPAERLGQDGADPAGGTSRTYRERTQRYLGGVTVGQISDGLDAFYRDYRNRSIGLSDGFEIVLRLARGEDVKALIQARRSAAAGK